MRLFICLALFFLTFCHQEARGQYGHIDFPASTLPELHPLFIKGILLLHNFQYDEAKDIFLELEKKDPHFALAYWGEAMTYNHPVWNEQDLVAGRNALNKLSEDPEERITKAKTPKETGLIQALNILYGEGDKKNRDKAYAEAMCQLYQQFPDDNEIATFYALSLLGKNEGVRNEVDYMKAASVAQDVISRNIQHPGAIHYLIHSVDDSIHAPLGLEAAYLYSVIAPDSSHAIHMPSHIFLALGMWEEVVQSNEKAWKVAKQGPYAVKDVHVLQWLHYGHLQLGHNAIAYDLLKTMYQLTQENNNNPIFNWYYSEMRAAHLIHTKRWDLDLPAIDMEGVEIDAVANDHFANALIRLYQDQQSIDTIIQQLSTLLESQKQKLEKQKKNTEKTSQPEGVEIAEIVLLQLKALNEISKGNRPQAQQDLEKAVSLEDQMPTGFGPPNFPKPSRELLGEFFLENKNLKEACKQFQEELVSWPNRYLALEHMQQIKKSDPSCYVDKPLFFHRLFKEHSTDQLLNKSQ